MGEFIAQLYLFKQYTNISKFNVIIEYLEILIDNIKIIIEVNRDYTKKELCDIQKKVIIELHKITEKKLSVADLNLKLKINFSDINYYNIINRLKSFAGDIKKKRELLADNFNLCYGINNSQINKIFKSMYVPINLIYINVHNVELFNWLLSMAIHSMSDKTKIRNYYVGLNNILLKDLKVIIPENFTADVYTEDDLNLDMITDESINNHYESKDYFTYVVIILNKLYKSSITLFDQDYTQPNKCDVEKYPDCGESTIRNFINILILNEQTNEFNIDKISNLGPVDNLKEYYKIFNNFSKQGDDKSNYDIYEKKLNPRDAWDILISNLPNVNYNEDCEINDNKNYNYNMRSGLSNEKIDGKYTVNILQVLKNLFTNINDWVDFEINDINLDVNLDDEGYGNILIDSHVGKFEWTFMDGHYVFKEITDKKEKIFNFRLSSNQKIYETVFLHNYDDLYTKYNNVMPNWYYYISYKPDDLIEFFNECGKNNSYISNEEYNIIFNYIYNNYDDDKQRRTNTNIFKLNNIEKYDLTKNYVQEIIYKDNTEAKKWNNIIKLYLGQEYNFEMKPCPFLTNLTDLRFGYYFNQNVDNLPNTLTHLRFGYYFNQNIDNLPNNLTHLTFGEKFNKNLTNLSKTLTHLIIGKFFNQNIDNLPSSLTHLTLGEYFDQRVDCLPENLTHLTLGYYFNQNVNNLPKKLTHLTLGHYFDQPVENLPKGLTNLTLGRDFNKNVDNLPNTLTHLIFPRYSLFKQNVNNLTNSLTHLSLSKSFARICYNLPHSLKELYINKDQRELFKNIPAECKVFYFTK